MSLLPVFWWEEILPELTAMKSSSLSVGCRAVLGGGQRSGKISPLKPPSSKGSVRAAASPRAHLLTRLEWGPTPPVEALIMFWSPPPKQR